MQIWSQTPSLAALNALGKSAMSEHLGIEIIEIGDDFLRARMPVNERTRQTYGILHGGASVVLAETLGSVAAAYCVDSPKKIVVGLDINANHVRPVKSGNNVIGTARPLHIGATTQVWEIRIENEQGALVCISRLTLAVIDRREFV